MAIEGIVYLLAGFINKIGGFCEEITCETFSGGARGWGVCVNGWQVAARPNFAVLVRN